MRHMRWMAILAGLAGLAGAAPRPATEAERQNWLNYLLPLPHEVAIDQAATFNPADVGLVINAEAGPVQAQIRDELTALFQESAGQAPTGSAFRIYLGVLDGQGRVGGQAVADAGRLKTCPNSKQAYLIRPIGDAGLIVAALDEKGLYYGAQTLRQLLSAGRGKNSAGQRDGLAGHGRTRHLELAAGRPVPLRIEIKLPHPCLRPCQNRQCLAPANG